MGYGLYRVFVLVERIALTILEAVNKVGSMFNGPLLALFCTALLLRDVPQRFALVGFVLGLLVNLALALVHRKYPGFVECRRFFCRTNLYSGGIAVETTQGRHCSLPVPENDGHNQGVVMMTAALCRFGFICTLRATARL